MTYRNWLLAAAATAACLAAPAYASEPAQSQTAGDEAAQQKTDKTPADQKATKVKEIVVTGRFIGTGAMSATKLNIPVADTPVSVSAYTKSFMKAIEVTEVADLYPYMTGVQRAGNTGYDLTIRGFQTSANDRNAIMVDGLPGLSVRFGSPPTIGTDHIEIVKGPESILYGQMEPGGFVNIISKKPSAVAETEMEVRGDTGAGPLDRARGMLASVDSTGPLTNNGALLYRFIAETGYDSQFRASSYERPLYIAPMLTWKVSPDTEVTGQVEYRQTRVHYDTYLVAPFNNAAFIAPSDTTYQEPRDWQTENGTTGSLEARHKLNDIFRLNASYRYVEHVDESQGVDVVAITPNGQQVTRRARGQLNTRTYSFGDIDLTGDFKLGPVRNQLVSGVNAGRETADLDRTQFYNLPAQYNVSVIDPQLGLLPALDTFPLVNPKTPQNLTDRYSAENAYGWYLSDLLTFTPQWKLMVGVRYSKEDMSIHEKRLKNVPNEYGSNDDWLPMTGLIYEPSSHLSFYTSYSTSFVPVAASNQDINGKYSFVPTTAHSIEGGVKANLFDHRLTFTLADFDIIEQNVINSFACPLGTCAQQVGQEESKGDEVEFDARPLRNLQISGGYSYLDATVTKSDIAQQVGARLINVPKNNAHIWARYDVENGPLAGLGAGLGVSYYSDRAGLLPTATSSATLIFPAYTTTDLALYYRVNKALDLTFKVTNLLDEHYYQSTGFSGAIQIVPGAPRTLTLTARTRF